MNLIIKQCLMDIPILLCFGDTMNLLKVVLQMAHAMTKKTLMREDWESKGIFQPLHTAHDSRFVMQFFCLFFYLHFLLSPKFFQ